MDDSRFDAWTRRRFGTVAGGLVALLVAGHAGDAARRKRRRRRKRKRSPKPSCPGFGSVCNADEPDCCAGLACDFVALGSNDAVCCKPDGAECTPETTCCSSNCDAETTTCTTCQGRACDVDRPCCALHECEDGFCGGCAARGAFCNAVRPCCSGSGDCLNNFCDGCRRSPDGIPTCPFNGVPCCETDCTGGLCLSLKDRPCEFDKDCVACNEDFDKCPGACDPASRTCTV